MARHALRGWTPIGFRATPEPTVEWADLRGQPFDAPFFSRTLTAWQAGEKRPAAQSDISILAALDEEPALDPSLIIAHPSRSGSTLLARLAASGDGTILVSEPAILSHLAHAKATGGCGRPFEQVLRQIVRGLGRIRFGTERRYVLKLSSQTTRLLPDLRRAFPECPVVWLQRQPAEIIESNLLSPPGPSDQTTSESLASRVTRRVTLAFLAATAFVDERVQILDYRDLPDAAWTKVTNVMGMEPTPGHIARMRDLALVDAKSGKLFTPRIPQPLPAEVQVLIRQTLDPLYQTLAARRLA